MGKESAQGVAAAAARKPGGPGPARVAGHPDDYLATVIARETYTRERFVLMTRVMAGLCAALVLSLGLNVYQAVRPVQYRFIAMDSTGRIKDLATLDNPLLKQSEVEIWVTDAIAKAFTFSFANYRQELTAAKDSFTPVGWVGFEKALDDSGVLKSVTTNRYVTTAVPTAAPVLLSQGLIEGRYAWRFQIPFLITYQNALKTTQSVNVTVIVVRMPETEQERGLGIASLIAE
jgi:intracellular multiplication protein IcmL